MYFNVKKIQNFKSMEPELDVLFFYNLKKNQKKVTVYFIYIIILILFFD